MTIDELYNCKSISTRTYNVCNSNGLTELKKILKYFDEFKTFDRLINCGRRTNLELIEICNNFKNFNSIESSLFINPLENLKRPHYEIINNFISINLKSLSNRSKNVLSDFLNGNFKIDNINEKILNNVKFDFIQLKKAGIKSTIELKFFINTLKAFLREVTEIENENDLILLQTKIFIERYFSITKIPDEILESRSIFRFAYYLIKKCAVFEKNENIIFQKAFKIYDDQSVLSLDEIAEELNISRERVRQIRKLILDNLFTNFQFLTSIDEDLYQKYNFDKNQKLIIIDDDLNKLINQINNTNFSIQFNSILIYIYLQDKFVLLGNLEHVLQLTTVSYKYRHNWNNFYLISQDLFKKFDFNKLVEDIHTRLNDTIEETYWFHFKGYLSNFINVEESSLISLVLPIAETIIYKEFDLYIDLNDNIVFKRNTVKQVPEFAIEALEKLGVPSNIEEIYKLIEKDFPEITKSKEALRGSLQRTPEVIYFGRSSTYGLKKWETEKEGIKGGTIKDIILDYLENKNYPVHILELLNEVHRYRKETNAKNIITNLKLDPQNQFLIFNQSFIGLSRKSYNSKLSNLPKFLGKTITQYVKNKGRINRLNIEEYFADQLDISLVNMKYIIEYLIENNFIKIDNQNNLTI